MRARQTAMIKGALGDAIAAQALALAEALKPLGERARLPVLDLATLKELSQPGRDRLLVTGLIEADRRASVSEFVLITICRRQFAGARRAGRL